jgi:hypothetical protein
VVQYIHLHRVGLQGLATLGTQKCFLELEPSGFLVTETCQVLYGREPTRGSGARVASGSWDLTVSPSLGTSAGFGSWDLDSPAEAPFAAGGGGGSGRLATNTMLIALAMTVM